MSGYLMGIDPGNTDSAYSVIDPNTRRPIRHGKVPNTRLLDDMRADALDRDRCDVDQVVIEMVASYGMPVGREVFNTCVWIGRYLETASRWIDAPEPRLVYRQPIKLHHCGSPRAKDSNVIQALVDRFAPGEPNRGKGTKASPGWFHGFAADVWQAYALAVYQADQLALPVGREITNQAYADYAEAAPF